MLSPAGPPRRVSNVAAAFASRRLSRGFHAAAVKLVPAPWSPPAHWAALQDAAQQAVTAGGPPLAPDAGAFCTERVLDLPARRLAAEARATVAAGIRDPFLWRAFRLRARMLMGTLSCADVASLLGCCCSVQLSDQSFLEAACRRLDVLLHCGRGSGRCGKQRPAAPAGALILACSSLLRLGLLPRQGRGRGLFDRLLRGIALGASRLSACDAALLSTCLARLRAGRREPVLLRRAAERLLALGSELHAKQGAMLLSSLVQLRRQRGDDASSSELFALEEAAAERLLNLIGDTQRTGPGPVGRRTLLAVLDAEGRRHEAAALAIGGQEEAAPSELALAAAERLARQRRAAATPAELTRLAATCAWLRSGTVEAALAPAALRELDAWASGRRPTWARLEAGRFLALLRAALPALRPPEDEGKEGASAAVASKAPTEALLLHLGRFCPEMSAPELASATELVSLGYSLLPASAQASLLLAPPGGDADGRGRPLATFLANQVLERTHELPLRELPRALASLQQIVDGEELAPVLRRVAGHMAMELAEAMQGGEAAEITEGFDADALGEILYVFAASEHRDVGFLDACVAWLTDGGSGRLAAAARNVSLVHLLHALVVLQAPRESDDYLSPLLSELVARMASLEAFELLGVLDAAALLQERRKDGLESHADSSPTDFTENGDQMLPPLGVGQAPLRSLLLRLDVLLPSLSSEDLHAFAHLLQNMELPEGENVRAVVDAVCRASAEAEERSGDHAVARESV
eukprot:TRINITY_DN22028_c0_g1_i1.p1 TRINITY_DN22028_c0_g1~~TRINITY_DN22028_c0_g1_i1.p1  ORF type:complete len:756 (+),score=188.05 TRINITY_DN22028_c0_g1_i1:62-2329(+)